MITIGQLEDSLASVDRRLEEIAKDAEVKDKVEKLVCLRHRHAERGLHSLRGRRFRQVRAGVGLLAEAAADL